MAYHVFLSFRGEDTRKTFTDHLYTALIGAGFRTFRDDDAIERGKDVKSELAKAINEARSSIVVLSKGYASSGWCLDELVMILKHSRSSSGAKHEVLPIFYDVDPSQVRKQTGSVGEAFFGHEERLNAETNASEKECLRKKVQAWRQALTDVADLAGMVLQNQVDGHESEFIQQILKKIGKLVDRPVLHVAHNLVGIESRAADINTWLQDKSSNVIAGIYGIGGIGKTTIAKFVCNLNAGHERFQASSFLANIREISNEPKGLVRLQRRLLSDILGKEQEKIWSVDAGIGMIKDVIGCKRVLVVLDDLDCQAQFDALIGKPDYWHPGSRVIITTRNIHLLKANDINVKFEVQPLHFFDSLELYRRYAFRQGHPVEGYNELSVEIVRHCGGLPLALQILGVLLHNRTLDELEEALKKLKDIPDSDIQKKLKISYDYLDDCDKELFLHIACFFIGKSKDIIERILGDLHPKVGIKTLSDRCLLTINRHNKLMMHQLIQQMGIEIVRQESPKEPGKRSRLCHIKDSLQVLSEKTGTETIQGLYLDMSHDVLEKDSRFKENFGVSNAKRPRSQELNNQSLFAGLGSSLKRCCLSLSLWRPTNNVGEGPNHVELMTDAFTRMHNLKLLQLSGVQIKGRYADFPRGLIYLCWHGFPLTSIPAEFSLNRLVHLDLCYSKLKQVWKGEMFLASLKVLNLSHSNDLKYTPIFTGVLNLEKLVLKHCISLEEIDESIGQLKSLVHLNLKGCKNLKKLPWEIRNLTSLKKFILSGCSKLDLSPAELGQMRSVTKLLANYISRETSLALKLRKSPKTLHSFPSSLVSLDLGDCNLSSVADCLGSLYSLRELDISRNPISSLPASIKGLAKLETLDLVCCTRLKSLPELPMTLQYLCLESCTSLETVKNLPNLRGPGELELAGVKMCEVPGIFKLEPIENVDAKIINELGISSEFKTIGNFEFWLDNQLYANYAMDQQFKRSTIQVLYEFGVHSIFLPRRMVPTGWWSSNKRIGSSITFDVPSLLSLKIQALKIYLVYKSGYPGCSTEWSHVFVKLNNITKGIEWAYTPWFKGNGPFDGKMDIVWLSYWKMGNQFVLEAGDKVIVSADYLDDRNPNQGFVKVREIGAQVVYGDPEEKDSQNHKAYSHHQNVTNAVDLSAYEWEPNHYHLCNFDGATPSQSEIGENIFGRLGDN